jgi:hypothetical protein
MERVAHLGFSVNVKEKHRIQKKASERDVE